ncbi:hypothetical protein VCHA34P131_40400 [Vibrio chagasii]|nr:hypothetical protein VCHA34P129_180008 [Vibrio chagasii]CAH6947638.1 hypothetical protein VCHA34P131_40400 [Vibrio chagasii]CAH6980697.1 hypothetical protein VCHA34P121_40372 [Vibrio chagasii]CAH7016714.1 hypothetical protein VCHA52P455_180073 [Vibrio chagasii]
MIIGKSRSFRFDSRVPINPYETFQASGSERRWLFNAIKLAIDDLPTYSQKILNL